MGRSQTESIRSFVIDNVVNHPGDLAAEISRQFKISRQAASRHIRNLTRDGVLTVEGETRGRKYALAVQTYTAKYTIDNSLEEHRVWREFVSPLLKDLPHNVYQICNHGFCEILNNARDHSEGATVEVMIYHDAKKLQLAVTDDGIGIFRKLKREFGLADEREAILELSKGKATTDPQHHSGEGIFFVSRAFDIFRIRSGRQIYLHTAVTEDWLFEDQEDDQPGTAVWMRIDLHSVRQLTDVFDQFSGPPNNDFSKTHVPVILAQYGHDQLVSRSQARRVLSRFVRFKEVLLDFNHVEFIGQAFADEIFRVFAREHPEVKLEVIRANDQVAKMISRAMSNDM
jgi:DNA-binding transcriptional ArsR family regulator